MKKATLIPIAFVLCLLTYNISAMNKKSSRADNPALTLKEARADFKTDIVYQYTDNYETPIPPAGELDLIQYQGDLGLNDAYITPNPNDGQRHPAIIWIFGGFQNSIGEFCWEDAAPSNDQSASIFREKGIVTMYPSFRGGNMNPGYYESFYGEVNDILSAYSYLKDLDYVDPDRIYLGGHSTGGTLALLAAEYDSVFRAVFSFGAVSSLKFYSEDDLLFETSNKEEYNLRDPLRYASDLKTPTFLIEGSKGNVLTLTFFNMLAKSNPNINCIKVNDKDHFDVLYSSSSIIADKILSDTDLICNIEFSKSDIAF